MESHYQSVALGFFCPKCTKNNCCAVLTGAEGPFLFLRLHNKSPIILFDNLESSDSMPNYRLFVGWRCPWTRFAKFQVSLLHVYKYKKIYGQTYHSSRRRVPRSRQPSLPKAWTSCAASHESRWTSSRHLVTPCLLLSQRT